MKGEVMEQKRGELTERVKVKSKELLGYEIDQEELRLMAYFQYVMMNEQAIDPERITTNERKILGSWRADGHVQGSASGLIITKEFWDAMCEILFLGYVDLCSSMSDNIGGSA